MNTDSQGGFLGLSPSTLAIIVIVVLIVVYGIYKFYKGRATVPSPSYITGFEDMSGNFATDLFDRVKVLLGLEKPFAGPKAEAKAEGFYGGVARGSGPDCLRSSSEGAALLGMFEGRASVMEEGSDDLRELKQIVGKLSCFKKDLVSPSYIVEATRYQPYVPAHDIEPISETTGRCFAKTVSPRDLELAFDKFLSRGELLMRKLCTEYRLTPAEVEQCEKLFRAVVRDVKDIARGACLQGEPIIAGKPGPRDQHPYEPEKYNGFGEYKGYY
jgi:hypothetical protein